MSRLATTFRNAVQVNQDRPLTNDQLMRVAPSIFAIDKHDSRSDRYTYIPTIDVLNGLRREGFQPFMAAQSRSRIEGKSDYTKHMIRLRHENQIQASEAFEVILVNSHDGTSKYQMLAGVMRFVCCNGLVAGDLIEEVRIPHRGSIVSNVIDAAHRVIDDLEPLKISMDRMKSIELDPREKRAFAEAALTLKYDELESSPIEAKQLLGVRRYDDRKDDLWTTFNVVQENMLRGGLHGETESGRKSTTREIKSIDNNLKLNKALWILGDHMAKLKS